MLSKDQIISLAACPVCCAMRDEPCTFARQDDPYGKRRAARQSHLDRMNLAREIFARPLDIPSFVL